MLLDVLARKAKPDQIQKRINIAKPKLTVLIIPIDQPWPHHGLFSLTKVAVVPSPASHSSPPAPPAFPAFQKLAPRHQPSQHSHSFENKNPDTRDLGVFILKLHPEISTLFFSLSLSSRFSATLFYTSVTNHHLHGVSLLLSIQLHRSSLQRQRAT